MKNLQKLPAKNIFRYFLIYKEHLLTCGLADDSREITVEALVDYVENHIDDETRMSYADAIWD